MRSSFEEVVQKRRCREIQQADRKYNLKKCFPTVRFTNRKFIVPVSYRNTLGDEIVAQETSTELPRHGAKAGSKNHRDAYLTGLFAALRTLKKFEEDDDKEYHVQDEKDNEPSQLNCISRGHSLGTLLRGKKVVRLKRRILANYALEHLKVLQ